MNARKKTSLKNLFFIVAAASISIHCGSFQGVSYYDSDGIYNSTSRSTPSSNYIAPAETRPQSQQSEPNYRTASNSGYYQNYFQNLSDEYASTAADNEVFVDVDAYNSPVQTNQHWGAQPNQTEVYIFNNRPNNPFFFGSGWGWNRFGPWGNNRFGWGFNNWNLGVNPYWGWAGFNSFYDPFWGGFYGPNRFFNPYRFYSPYAYRSRFFRNNNNRFFDSRAFERQRYSRVASRRGEKTYSNSNRNSRQTTDPKSETKNTKKPREQYNIGRNLYSIGYGRIPANLGSANRSFQSAVIPASGAPTQANGTATRSASPKGNSNYGNTSRYNTGRKTSQNGRNRSNTSRTNTSPKRSYNTNRSYNNSSSPSISRPIRATGSRRSSGGRTRGGGRTNN